MGADYGGIQTFAHIWDTKRSYRNQCAMAYENTHIYLADRIREKIDSHILKRMISDHMDYYFLGSIFPDILFYCKDKQIFKVAHNLHGEDGVPTNQIVFNLLDEIKSKKDKKKFAYCGVFNPLCRRYHIPSDGVLFLGI